MITVNLRPYLRFDIRLPQQPQRRFFHSFNMKGWLATAHQDRGIQTDGIRACALKSHWAGS